MNRQTATQQKGGSPKPMAPPATPNSQQPTMEPVPANISNADKIRWANLTKKKKSIRMKEKRQRENKRLIKMLIPKHALMVIHELKGVTLSEFVITTNPDSSFTAEVVVNNEKYQGVGTSKIKAKNAACEKALRNLMIQKLMRRYMALKRSQEPFADLISDPNLAEEEEVPMLPLISYALHKLYAEWEAEGFVVPDFKLNPSSSNQNSDVEMASVISQSPCSNCGTNQKPSS